MAGTRSRLRSVARPAAAPSSCRSRACPRSRGKYTERASMSERAHPSHGRRQLLRYAGASLILSVTPLAGAASKLPSVLAVRIWPAADYTRVTLEHDGLLKFTHFTVENPDRLVVDIEGVEFNSVLDSLAGNVATDDPNTRRRRAGRFRPGVVRLVMKIKTKVNPQFFTLEPA